MIKELNVKGMHCKSCVALIKMGLEDLGGVNKVEGDFEKGRVLVDFDEKKITLKEISSKIEEDGYKVVK